MVPALRAGDYYGGIVGAVNDLTGLIRGEALPAPKARKSDPVSAPQFSNERSRTTDVLYYLTLVLLVTILLPSVPALVGARLSQKLSPRFPQAGEAAIAAVAGALSGALGYVVCGVPGGLAPVAGSILAALGAVGLMLLMQHYLLPWLDRNSAGVGGPTSSGAGTGSWTERYLGSGSSGDHGGSSSGSDGFSSGGGGSYAGGGASGRW